MARISCFFLLFSIILVASTPSTNSAVFNGQTIQGIEVQANITSSGVFGYADVIATALGGYVSVRDTRSSQILEEGAIDSNGNSIIGITNLTNTPLVPSTVLPWITTIQILADVIPLLPNGGLLSSEVFLTNYIVHSTVVNGLAAVAVSNNWTLTAKL